MKVVCEGCSTKYSIGDEKVAGKVFKIRCKKCSRVILVRGEPAAAAPPVAAEPEWHVVQDGRQLGPFDSGELQRRRAAGALDDDSYVWREGFTDWQAIGAVEELRPALSMPMPIADEPAHGEPAHAAGALFGGAAAHAATSNGTEASRLRGERNESSVLFTLDNLARLAAPAPAQASSSPSSSGARGAAGAAGGEGSGLIDIRALARTYTPGAARGGDRAGVGRSGSNIGSMADLPVFAAATFVEPGVLVPRAPQRDRRLVVGLVAAFGMLAICAALLLVVMLTRDGEPAVTTAPLSPPGPRVAAISPPVPARTVSPAVIEPPAVPVRTVTETTPPPARTVTETTPPPVRTTTTTPARTTTTTPARTTTTTPARTTTTTPARTTTTTPPEQAKCDQVTCIVNGNDSDCCRALQGNALNPTRPVVPTTSSQLPESLDRTAINEGLATISTKSCGGVAPAGSLVKAHLKVSAAGAVTAVTVQSSPDEALSACMVAQIQKGRFKKTQRGGSFAYPWRF